MDQPLSSKQPSGSQSSGSMFSGPKAPPVRKNLEKHSQKLTSMMSNTASEVKTSSAASFIPESVVIRTMKDDLQQGSKQPVSAKPTPPPRKRTESVVTAPTPELPVSPVSKKGTDQPQKTKKSGSKSPRGRKVIMLISLLLIVFGLGSAAAWWYYYEQPTQSEPEDTRILSAYEVLPQNASLIIHYSLSSQQKRANIRDLWSNNSSINFLSGNPSGLLSDNSVTDIYYVLLPNDPRLFAIIPKNEATANYVAQYTEEQLYSIGNWYVVHTIAARPYQQVLQQGTMPQTVNITSLAESTGIQWLFNPEYLASTYGRAYDIGITTTTDNFLLFNAAYSPTQNTLSFTTEDAPVSTSDIESELVTALRSKIPGDASFVWIGTSLKDDSAQFTLPGFDGSILNERAVRALLDQLDVPYVYYARSGADNVRDVGLVIAKPTVLDGQLVNGDAVFEKAIHALLPSILGRSVSADELGLSFANAEYNGIPLRYVNIIGSTQALDYAVTSDFIYISSSKEGMFTLLDTAEGEETPSITTMPPWQSLVAANSVITAGQSLVLDTLDQELFMLLTGQPQGNVFMRAVVTITETSRAVTGALLRGVSNVMNSPTSSSSEGLGV